MSLWWEAWSILKKIGGAADENELVTCTELHNPWKFFVMSVYRLYHEPFCFGCAHKLRLRFLCWSRLTGLAFVPHRTKDCVHGERARGFPVVLPLDATSRPNEAMGDKFRGTTRKEERKERRSDDNPIEAAHINDYGLIGSPTRTGVVENQP